jgi:hypothetical protein
MLERAAQLASAQAAASRAVNDDLQRAVVQLRAELDRAHALVQMHADAAAGERARAGQLEADVAALRAAPQARPLLGSTGGSTGSGNSGSGQGSLGYGLPAAIMALFVLPVESLAPNEAAALEDALNVTAERLRDRLGSRGSFRR